MKNFRFSFLLIVTLLAGKAFAQDSTSKKIKEYYITLADISPFSVNLKYKRQIGSKTLIKVGLVNLYFQSNSQHSGGTAQFPVQNTSYQGGIELGLEFRKSMVKRFSFFHGPNLRYTYYGNLSVRNDPSLLPAERKYFNESHMVSLPYTLGILFNLNSKILLAAEINPAINFQTTVSRPASVSNQSYYSNGIGLVLDNRQGFVSLVYRLN